MTERACSSPIQFILLSQCAVHRAVQIGSALVGSDDHDHGVVLEGDHGVLHIFLGLCELSVVAVNAT